MADEPEGLAFMTRMAELLCREHHLRCDWSRDEAGNVYTLRVSRGDSRLDFQFDAATLSEADSDAFRAAALALLDRIRDFARSA